MTQETLKNLLIGFTKYLEDKGRSPSTVLAYKSDLEQLTTYLENRQKLYPEQVTQDLLEAFRDALLSEKFTPKTVSRKLNAIKTLFRYLVAENHISKDPSLSVAHPKLSPTDPKFLTPLEYRALRDVARSDKRVSAIIELILQTGLRISEIATLKINNIKPNQLVIDAYATQPERVIPLNLKAKQQLDDYLKERPMDESPYVFISKNGKPLAVRNIRASVDRFMLRAEISGYSVNDLRTTFIVENLKAGVDIVFLSQVTGHKRISTTEKYLEMAEVKEPGKKQILEEL